MIARPDPIPLRWARYYHPRLQRFISEDPLQFGGGDLNVYAYARNNPIRFTDPQGLFLSWVHRWIARRALKLEGCSDDFADSVAGYDVDADSDFDT